MSSTPNLVVQLNKVADTPKQALKNVKLFVNDKEILLEADTRVSEGNLIYQLQLAGGVYKIKAVYYFRSFWRDKEYNITTRDGKVRVYPNQQTVLNITFDKKMNGDLKHKKNYFAEQVEALTAPFFQTTDATPPPTNLMPEKIEIAPVESRSERQILPIAVVNEESQRVPPAPEPGRRIEFPDPLKSITSPRPERVLPGEATPLSNPAVATPPPAPIEQTPRPAPPEPALAQPAPEPARVQPAPEQPVPARAGKIALQINTVPIHCDVIVDDKMVGQSPLTVYIDRFSNHVVQIFREGYEEKTKIIDQHLLGHEAIYLLIEKLEPKK